MPTSARLLPASVPAVVLPDPSGRRFLIPGKKNRTGPVASRARRGGIDSIYADLTGVMITSMAEAAKPDARLSPIASGFAFFGVLIISEYLAVVNS